MIMAHRMLRSIAVAGVVIALAACASTAHDDDLRGNHGATETNARDDQGMDDHAPDDHAPDDRVEDPDFGDLAHADPGYNDHAHDDPAIAAGRLLVGTDAGTLAVLDARDGGVHAVFAGALPAGDVRVHVGSSGELAYAVNSEASIVAVVDSGQILYEHDGHEDLVLGDAGIIGYIDDGFGPSCFTSTFGIVGIYNEESGDITVIDERRIRIDFDWVLVPARVGQGVPVLLRDRLIVGHAETSFLEIMDYGGHITQRIEGIDRPNAHARVGRYTVFGSAGGAFVVTQNGSEFSGHLLPSPPQAAEDARMSRLAAHPVLPYFVGDLGSALVRIDPISMTTELQPLPAGLVDVGVDRSGRYIVALGEDGVVYVIDSESFLMLSSLPAVAGRDPGMDSAIPSLALGNRMAYVTDPSDNRILAIDLDEGEIALEMHLGLYGTITSIAAMVTDGIVH